MSRPGTNARTNVGLKVAFLLVTFMVAGSVGVQVAATGPLRPPARFWCEKSGIRYSGVTAQGGPVCFTLTPGGTGLREIGYTFVSKNRCPESTNYVGPVNPPFEVPGGRINLQGVGLLFRGWIVGSTASGVLSDGDACPGQRVHYFNLLSPILDVVYGFIGFKVPSAPQAEVSSEVVRHGVATPGTTPGGRIPPSSQGASAGE
jgi:hypothetical protein